MSELAYFQSPKALAAGSRGVLLDLIGRAWCADHDAELIPSDAVPLLGFLAGLNGQDLRMTLERLCEAELWSFHPDGFTVSK